MQRSYKLDTRLNPLETRLCGLGSIPAIQKTSSDENVLPLLYRASLTSLTLPAPARPVGVDAGEHACLDGARVAGVGPHLRN